jgi:hypothetical protein
MITVSLAARLPSSLTCCHTWTHYSPFAKKKWILLLFKNPLLPNLGSMFLWFALA